MFLLTLNGTAGCAGIVMLPAFRRGDESQDEVLCRAKSATYGSDSEDECISPASPEPPSSPNMNDVEMEIAQELNALQRGVPSTTRRRLSSCSPVPKLPASQA